MKKANNNSQRIRFSFFPLVTSVVINLCCNESVSCGQASVTNCSWLGINYTRGCGCIKNSRCATLDYRAANTKPVGARNRGVQREKSPEVPLLRTSASKSMQGLQHIRFYVTNVKYLELLQPTISVKLNLNTYLHISTTFLKLEIQYCNL